MTRLGITETGLQHHIDAIRALYKKDKRYPDRTRLDALERRILRAYRRNNTGTAQRDGYPTTTLGGTYTRTNGSSVEAQALAPPIRDRHHELTVRAVDQIEQIVTYGIWLEMTLDAIEALTNDQGPAPRTCAACTGHRLLGGNQAVSHRGTVGNRLSRAVDLCEPCYGYVTQTADPGTHAGRLPTPVDIASHDRTGRWRLRTNQ